MNTSELVAAVILKATGKAKTLQPADSKYKKILGIANMYIRQWQSEPGVDWTSLYDPAYSLGTVSATNQYSLDLDEVRKISDVPGDVVKITTDDGVYEFPTVPADQLNLYHGGNYCAQINDTLQFARTFDTDSPEYGGTIEVPVYLRAELLTRPTSTVPVDDPMWLVVICAAEYVRPDSSTNYLHPDLVAEANQLMQKMIDNNGAQTNQLYAPSIPGISDT